MHELWSAIVWSNQSEASKLYCTAGDSYVDGFLGAAGSNVPCAHHPCTRTGRHIGHVTKEKCGPVVTAACHLPWSCGTRPVEFIWPALSHRNGDTE